VFKEMSKNQNRNQNENRENLEQKRKNTGICNDQLGENMTEFAQEVNPNNEQQKRKNNNRK